MARMGVCTLFAGSRTRSARRYLNHSPKLGQLECDTERLFLHTHTCQTNSGRGWYLFQKKLSFQILPQDNLTYKQVTAFSTFIQQKNHYEILNVSKTATTEEIRHAFLSLSKLWHPDTDTQDPTRHKKFVQINEAYTVLSKPLSRRDYDLSLEAERYVSRQMNAAGSRTYGYGYPPHPGPYYHYRQHAYEDAYSSTGSDNASKEEVQGVISFYLIMGCFTLTAVLLLLGYMHTFMADPKRSHLRNDLTKKDIEKYEFIMQAEQNGNAVYYYAVPREDSKKYDVVVLQKKLGDDSKEFTEMTRNSV